MIVSAHGMKAAAEGGHLTGRVRASALFEVLGVGDRVNYSVAGKQLNISSKVGGEEGKRDLLRVHARRLMTATGSGYEVTVEAAIPKDTEAACKTSVEGTAARLGYESEWS